ncbi:hypothetical protein DDI74_04025 [Chryseobacterium gleum]|uniref:AAA family ATPase n=1 Tax=Chryseobacterium gleum TaxID=250 RepID=UPI0010404B2B|nr:AAA family ATPase [Chryseobacterium gleum]QBJ85476.1 hypothetical protein DDI74_04025 [Chryseobacterium gleum]
MEIFRLNNLYIRDNDIFKKEITFDFSQDKDKISLEVPYLTLIIGVNGTGKSYLLKLLIDIFRLALDKKKESESIYYPSGKYNLEYVLGNSVYNIGNTISPKDKSEKVNYFEKDKKEDKGIRFWKNGNEVSSSSIEIPKSILALSIMLTDKYLFLKEPQKFPIYKYLGVRRDNNTAGTRSFIGKTIDNIYAALGNEAFLENLSEMLSFLELSNEFHISYLPRYKEHFFSPNLTEEKFEDFFLNNKKYLPRRTTEPWSVATFKQLKETQPEIIPKLVDLLHHLTRKLICFENSRSQYFIFDIFDIKPSLQKLLPLLPYLHSLNIISYPEIRVKKGRHYKIGESSSGEYHFISTIVGLLATITDNSLVLIDEPEISLHPNWQMKYVAFLNKIFKKYNSVHFLICSHSHFLVSDLKAENSSIISLKREDWETKATSIKTNTFGWSAEEVLLEVFNVPTTRNLYVYEKLGEILDIIALRDTNERVVSENKFTFEVKKRINELQDLGIDSLSNEDPLKEVIEKLIEKYGRS